MIFYICDCMWYLFIFLKVFGLLEIVKERIFWIVNFEELFWEEKDDFGVELIF